MRVTDHNVEAFVREHEAELLAYLRFLGCTVDEAEDLAQEALLIALRHPDRIAGKSVGAFLARSAGLIRLERLRVTARRDEILRGEAASRWWDRRTGVECFADYREALAACLAGLGKDDRRVLDLHYRDGRPGSEIAETLGLGVANVHARLSRLRARLRICIERRRAT
ncbi:MAG: RNA polymerase sigma factor [Planctomycetes bacterium]|nr:RNA polymerase sigma factor [Planctomycetota bacterium]